MKTQISPGFPALRIDTIAHNGEAEARVVFANRLVGYVAPAQNTEQAARDLAEKLVGEALLTALGPNGRSSPHGGLSETSIFADNGDRLSVSGWVAEQGDLVPIIQRKAR